jgi:hypothetical protein
MWLLLGGVASAIIGLILTVTGFGKAPRK